MIRRLLYFTVPIILTVFLVFIGKPYIDTLYTTNVLTLEESKVLYMSVIFTISIILGLILISEGRHYMHMQFIGGIIVLLRVIDVIRFSIFPRVLIELNIVSFFGALFVFALGVVIIKQVLFKHSVGVYVVLFSLITALRFPVMIDVIYMYVQKFSVHTAPYIGYYNGVMVVYYITLFIQLLVMDKIVKENLETFRYKYQ